MDFIIALIVFTIVGICLYLNKNIALYFLITCATVGGCSYVNKRIGQHDDWLGEEIVEEILKDQLEIEIDLTPDTPEG